MVVPHRIISLVLMDRLTEWVGKHEAGMGHATPYSTNSWCWLACTHSGDGISGPSKPHWLVGWAEARNVGLAALGGEGLAYSGRDHGRSDGGNCDPPNTARAAT